MKKRTLLLLAGVLLMCGCSKEEKPVDSLEPTNSYSDNGLITPNTYETITDEEFELSDMYSNTVLPDAIYLGSERYDIYDFRDKWDLFDWMESINQKSILNKQEWQITLNATGNTTDMFEATSKLTNENQHYYFNPVDYSGESTGQLDIELTITDQTITGVTLHYCKDLLLTYDAYQINVLKTGSYGINEWSATNFSIVSDPVVTPDPETNQVREMKIIDRDHMYLDDEITLDLETLPDGTYTGVQYLSIDGAGVFAQDIKNTDDAITSVLRLASASHCYCLLEGVVSPIMITADTPAETLSGYLKDYGTLKFIFAEYYTNNEGVIGTLTEEEFTLIARPTYTQEVPMASVSYTTDAEAVPWLPYEHNHQMKVTFGD